MNIESKLSALFDYQKFENNKSLSQVISDDANRIEALSDDDLNMVSAAGNVNTKERKEDIEMTDAANKLSLTYL